MCCSFLHSIASNFDKYQMISCAPDVLSASEPTANPAFLEPFSLVNFTNPLAISSDVHDAISQQTDNEFDRQHMKGG
jgi:hypothetical protein